MNRLEWFLALKLITARRTIGGVTLSTLVSLLGITLAVAALIVTLSVRSGFRTDFVETLLGSNAHLTIAAQPRQVADGRTLTAFPPTTFADLPYTWMPVVRGQVMVTGNAQAGADVYGIHPQDVPLLDGLTLDTPWTGTGLMIGHQLAQTLGVGSGDTIRMLSPDGARTAFGTSPRVHSYPIETIVQSGRWDVDNTRIWMPFAEAQSYFNRTNLFDQAHVFLEDPASAPAVQTTLLTSLADEGVRIWTWQDTAGGFLRALDLEDRVMFIILSTLVIIASMSIISGLVMLTRNKTSTIGILRTLGMTQGGIGRVFFLCGTLIGITGTALGVALGITTALNLDAILALVGKDLWDPAIRSTYTLPTALHLRDVLSAAGLALGLSMLATLIPAIAAARMTPVEALDV